MGQTVIIHTSRVITIKGMFSVFSCVSNYDVAHADFFLLTCLISFDNCVFKIKHVLFQKKNDKTCTIISIKVTIEEDKDHHVFLHSCTKLKCCLCIVLCRVYDPMYVPLKF